MRASRALWAPLAVVFVACCRESAPPRLPPSGPPSAAKGVDGSRDRLRTRAPIVPSNEYVPPTSEADALRGLLRLDLRYRIDSVSYLREHRTIDKERVAIALVDALADPLWPEVSGEVQDWRQRVAEALKECRPIPAEAMDRLVLLLRDGALRAVVLDIIAEGADAGAVPQLRLALSSADPAVRYIGAVAISRLMGYGRVLGREESPIVADVVATFVGELRQPQAVGFGAPLVELGKWGSAASVARADVMALLRGASEVCVADAATLTAIRIGVPAREILEAIAARSERGDSVLNMVVPVAESLGRSRSGVSSAPTLSELRAVASRLRASGVPDNMAASAVLLGAIREPSDADIAILRDLALGGEERTRLHALISLQSHGRLDRETRSAIDVLAKRAASEDVRMTAASLSKMSE